VIDHSTWLTAAALTFAASAHCVGMCGGFALALAAPSRPRVWRALAGHLALQLGKGTSYAFLGALAGAFGAALLASPTFVWGARALALLCGLALVAAGLTLLGLRRGGDAVAARLAPHLARVTGPLLQARPRGAALVVGMVMGFLPCPLVYAGLAGAAASGSAAAGALLLVGVALGTVPALLALALFGGALRERESARRLMARAAGALLIAVGVITLARGLGLHAGHAGHGAPAPAAGRPADPHAHHH
jgi:hypothetical protein